MYHLDRETILKKAYYLMCLFFANKEIARRSDPKDKKAPLSTLESLFFVNEASRLLIEIAIAVRVIDDQMRRLPSEDTVKMQFEKRKSKVDQYTFGLFDDLNLGIRETCNKIIHSDVMEPHYSEGREGHELDISYNHGVEKRTIDWEHFNGNVRLCGADRKGKKWYVLLDLEVFVTATIELLNP